MTKDRLEDEGIGWCGKCKKIMHSVNLTSYMIRRCSACGEEIKEEKK